MGISNKIEIFAIVQTVGRRDSTVDGSVSSQSQSMWNMRWKRQAMYV
jgi:hypothetical protein